MEVASPPSALMRSTRSSSASSRRAETTTEAPRLASVLAVSRPMPDDAPVMTITCWSRGFAMMIRLLLRKDEGRTICAPLACNPAAWAVDAGLRCGVGLVEAGARHVFVLHGGLE